MKKRIFYGSGLLILIIIFSFFAYKFKKYNNNKISIIIPVYNASKYLSVCLDSVMNQTYKDLEIICVNDGSTDNSLDILQNYSSMDNRIVVLNQENSGVSTARNAGLKIATGKYIEFIDSDDLINSKTCESLFNEAEFYNADIIRFKKEEFYNDIPPDVNRDLTCNMDNAEFYIHSEYDNPFDSNDDCNVVLNKFYKKSFLTDNNLFFDERVRLGEDSLFCWDSFILNSTVVIDKNLYYYHRKDIPTSLMGSSSSQKWFDNRMRMITHLIERKNNFKFPGYQLWIIGWSIEYTMEIFDFGTQQVKSDNAKLFFNTIEKFLIDEDISLPLEYSQKIEKIKSLIY